MTRPTRETQEGRIYLLLRALARKQKRTTAEILQLYALERFVARLAASPDRERFVLKGGLLMAAFGERRPTRDVDLLALGVDNDLELIRDHIFQIASYPLDDGIQIDAESVRARVIREGAHYSGVRVSLRANLASARLAFHVDVNVGDPVKPSPSPVELPSLLGGEALVVLAYPVEMVIAEKLVTAFERGGTNTRWRDFVDLLLLMGHATDIGLASVAVEVVAEHRKVALGQFRAIRDDLAEHAQPKWAAWRRKQGLTGRTPESLDELLVTIEPWADLLLQSPGKSR